MLLVIKTDGLFPLVSWCHCLFFIGGVMEEENMDPYYLYTEAIRMVLIDHEQIKSMMMVAVAGMLLSNSSYTASFFFYFFNRARWPLHLEKFLLQSVKR